MAKKPGKLEAVLRSVASFDAQPDDAFLNIDTLVMITDRGRSTIWRESAQGTFPKGVKIGHSTRWRVGDVRQWLRTRGA